MISFNGKNEQNVIVKYRAEVNFCKDYTIFDQFKFNVKNISLRDSTVLNKYNLKDG